MSYFTSYNQAREREQKERERDRGCPPYVFGGSAAAAASSQFSVAQRFKTKYLIVHCKHAGCYEFNFIEHRETKARFIPVTINTPKVFMFENKEEAREFFNEYMADIDTVDPKCRVNGEIQHVECCSCGVIDLDEEEQPNLFYNKTNQIFLLEHTAETFMANQNIRSNINNLNITNNFMKKCKSMPEEQRRKYIDLGKMCEECNLEGYLEKVEREEREKKEAEQKKMQEDEKRLEQEEKRRREDTEQLANLIFFELERKLGSDSKTASMIDDLKSKTNVQLQKQFEEQLDNLRKSLKEPKHKPNKNSDEPKNVIVTELERRAPGPLAAAKGSSLFAKHTPPPSDSPPTPAISLQNNSFAAAIAAAVASVSSSATPPLPSASASAEEPKKRKYTKKKNSTPSA